MSNSMDRETMNMLKGLVGYVSANLKQIDSNWQGKPSKESMAYKIDPNKIAGEGIIKQLPVPDDQLPPTLRGQKIPAVPAQKLLQNEQKMQLTQPSQEEAKSNQQQLELNLGLDEQKPKNGIEAVSAFEKKFNRRIHQLENYLNFRITNIDNQLKSLLHAYEIKQKEVKEEE